MLRRLSLRTRFFLLFALLIAACAACLAAAIAFGVSRLGREALPVLVLSVGVAGFVLIGATLRLWLWFDENVARPIVYLAHDLMAITHADAEPASLSREAAHLGVLAPAAREVAAALTEERRQTDTLIAQATARAERQKARLEAVLHDVSQGVVICDLQHRILLYNRTALRILHAPERPDENDDVPAPDSPELGLGRSFLDVVSAQPIRHIVDRLSRRFAEGRHHDHDEGLGAMVVFSDRRHERMLQGVVLLMLDSAGRTPEGYVISFDDITERISTGVGRDRQVAALRAQLKRAKDALAALRRCLVEELALSDRERGSIAEPCREAEALIADIGTTLEDRQEDALTSHWPTADVFSPTLLKSIADGELKPAGVSFEIAGDPVWLHCDDAAISALFLRLALRISHRQGTRKYRLQTLRADKRATLSIHWSGDPPTSEDLDHFLSEPLDGGTLAQTGLEVLERHHTVLHGSRAEDGSAFLEIVLPLSPKYHFRQAKAPERIPERREFYDFDLLGQTIQTTLHETSLRQLTFVVFDCETTGLEPARGDEMVSLAGVRIVNGRILSGEVFSQLIHPGRKIPAASTRIHGIDDRMVEGAPLREAALRRFHAFARDAVLVAHNAAFDMAFLTKDLDDLDLSFDQPVLDTVLLAAHLQGTDKSLTLDALAERFSVTLRDEDRHTALGDALATAEVFLRLIDMLEAASVYTLSEALEVSALQTRLRRRQAAYGASLTDS